MSLRINDIAPDFTAETTQGTIHFHEWIGDNWAVLFSHPKDFTPVCTTELGAVGSLEQQFASRGAKVIGQDQGSSVVYGMPRSAKEAGVVDRELPLENIPGEIKTALGI